jgi:hypothetical protein
MAIATATALTACGRIDFDLNGDGGRGSSDAAIGDASTTDAAAGPRLLAHVQATSGGDVATTTAIDTTGATLLVASVVGYMDSTLFVMDSLGNAWHALALAGPSTGGNGTGTTSVAIVYCANPVTGSDTFSVNATGGFATIEVTAWSGTASSGTLDTESGNNANGLSTFSAGPIHTAISGELVIALWGSNNNYSTQLTDISIAPAPFMLLDAALNPAGESIAVGVATDVAVGTYDPAWTMGPDATTAVAAIAAFRPQ